MRRIAISGLAVLALCLALATPALAITQGVTGVVRSITTGKVIAGAVVTKGTVKVTTNVYGVYAVSAAVGRYTLSITKPGYLRTYQMASVVAGKKTYVNWYLTNKYPTNAVPVRSLTILGWNDLGMHCDQDSYKYMCILPPYNTLHVQLFAGEGGAPSGVTVSYYFPKKTNSALSTDFWTYAKNFDSSWSATPNVGISGTRLSGQMVRDAAGKGWVAKGIPVTPYDDDGTWDPYAPATVVVKNSLGTVLGATKVVTPVSTEMTCSNCHSGSNAAQVAQNILTAHDADQGTTLLSDANAGHPHACFECHADNALGKHGLAGVPSLSLAMHKKHDGKIANTTAGCSNCHPGPKTKCLRGVMARAGKSCVSCHGTISTVWKSISTGRRPWVDEPKCSTCHGAKHAENAGKLYRDSLLTNSLTSDMNNRIYCEACHNSTHAEYVSRIASDAIVPKTAQGNSYWIYNCKVCHKSGGFTFAGQLMHR